MSKGEVKLLAWLCSGRKENSNEKRILFNRKSSRNIMNQIKITGKINPYKFVVSSDCYSKSFLALNRSPDRTILLSCARIDL